jgi:hypothetical protein
VAPGGEFDPDPAAHLPGSEITSHCRTAHYTGQENAAALDEPFRSDSALTPPSRISRPRFRPVIHYSWPDKE